MSTTNMKVSIILHSSEIMQENRIENQHKNTSSMTIMTTLLNKTTYKLKTQTNIQYNTLSTSYSARKFDHVTPLLRELHWLRVPERITFKLASLVFRCLNGTAPLYLANSINCAAVVETRRSLRLRSSSLTAVDVPVTRRSTIGDRAFSVAGKSLLFPD